MYSSTVTHKGQITIPAHFRHALDIREGDKVEFIPGHEGILILPFREKSISELQGYFPKPQKTLSIEEMNMLIETQS